jgi:hypothetical protein
MKLWNFSCFSKLLINLKYRLQTGMRGCLWKAPRYCCPREYWTTHHEHSLFWQVQGCCHRIPSPSQVPWTLKGILFVKGVKNVHYLYCFFQNRFTSPRNGDSLSLWNNERECSAGTWWRKRQVSPRSWSAYCLV